MAYLASTGILCAKSSTLTHAFNSTVNHLAVFITCYFSCTDKVGYSSSRIITLVKHLAVAIHS